MRQAVYGCLGSILGFVLGVALTVGFFNNNVKPTILTPVAVSSSASARSDVSVVANADFINLQIQPAARATGILKQTSMSLEAPNIVRVSALVDTTLLGQRVTASPTTTMRIAVKNNRITLSIDKIDSGNPAIPASLLNGPVETLRAQAEDLINRQIQRALQGTNMRVVNVRMTPNDMTIDLASQ